MATYLGPQDSANMPQAQWQEMFGGMWSSGVLAGQLNSYVVTTTSGLGISVASGKAMIQGFLARSDAAVALTAAAADPTNPRIDRAVLHADLSAHTLTVQLLTGTPAPSPTPPALTQTSTVWEISLYQVRVNAGAATITSLTDERTFSAPNIPTGAVTSSMIANGAVGTADIAAGAITDGLMANQKVNRAGDTMTGALTAPAFHGLADNATQLQGHAPGSGNGLDADTTDGWHISTGAGVPGSVPANTIYFQLS